MEKIKYKIKKGDTVKVITGDSKGQQGTVLTIDREKGRVLIEGVNKVSKHARPDAKNPQGGIVQKEAYIHISNVMLVDGKGNATRIGRKLDEKSNKIVRISKKSKEVIK